MLEPHLFRNRDEDYRGRVQRRAERHDQGDSRGQYPRQRSNDFARSQTPRVKVRYQQPPPPQEQYPQQTRNVYADEQMQYEQPATPYIPGYMQDGQQRRPQQQRYPQQQQNYPAPHLQNYGNQQDPYTLMSEKNTDKTPLVKRSTLIVLVSIAVLVLAAAFTARSIFAAETEAIYETRAAAEEALYDTYPVYYQDIIEEKALDYNLNPAFVMAIILNESSFDPYAESSVGARGLMQTMEDTAEWIYEELGVGTGYSFDMMYDAETNVEYGCWYLAYLSDKFNGDPILVTAAFHSGQTNVTNWLNNEEYSLDQQTISLDRMPEGNTKNYVVKVLNAYAAYLQLYYEEVDS